MLVDRRQNRDLARLRASGSGFNSALRDDRRGRKNRVYFVCLTAALQHLPATKPRLNSPEKIRDHVGTKTMTTKRIIGCICCKECVKSQPFPQSNDHWLASVWWVCPCATIGH